MTFKVAIAYWAKKLSNFRIPKSHVDFSHVDILLRRHIPFYCFSRFYPDRWDEFDQRLMAAAYGIHDEND